MTTIKSNERVVFIGKTGSGKSYLAKKLMSNFDKIIFLDIKHEHNFIHEYPYYFSVGNIVKFREYLRLVHTKEYLEPIYKKFFIHYMPENFDADDLDIFCQLTYFYGNIVVIMDEVESFGGKFIDSHRKLIRLGRTRSIGVWHLIQRPVFVDNYILSESEHIFIFKLNLKADREKMKGIIGEEAETAASLEKYHYIYCDKKTDVIKKCKPI